MEKHIDKDGILRHLSNRSTLEDKISTIAATLSLDFNYCVSICDEIITDQYVNSVKLASHDKSLKISPRGLNFLTNEGGYTEKHRKEKIEKKKADREAWPRRNWLLVAIITGIIGAAITYFFERIDKSPSSQTVQLKDSSSTRK